MLHNPAGMGGKKKTAKVIPSPEEDAARGCYWTKDKSSLAFPSDNIQTGLTQAAAGCKSLVNRKLSLGPLISGDISIEPEMVPFNTTEYQIDSRRGVIQRQGVILSRPKIFPWTLTFNIAWEAQYLGIDFHESTLPDLLERLGKTIGLGAFRPAKKGRFGRFEVVAIEKLEG